MCILATLGLCLTFPAACNGPGYRRVSLISNIENTRFEIRPLGGEWRHVGTGKVVYVPKDSLPLPSEIQAAAPDYWPEVMTVTQVQMEFRFTFEKGDRKSQPPPLGRKMAIELDIQVLAVNAETTLAVNGRAEDLSDPRKAIDECAADLLENPILHGKRIVVLFLKAGEGADERLGVTAYGMLVTALHNSGRVTLTEREQLGKILSERGLKESDLVDKPALGREIGRLLGADYLVTGVISKVGAPKE
jgi:hypothetical protein